MLLYLQLTDCVFLRLNLPHRLQLLLSQLQFLGTLQLCVSFMTWLRGTALLRFRSRGRRCWSVASTSACVSMVLAAASSAAAKQLHQGIAP